MPILLPQENTSLYSRPITKGNAVTIRSRSVGVLVYPLLYHSVVILCSLHGLCIHVAEHRHVLAHVQWDFGYCKTLNFGGSVNQIILTPLILAFFLLDELINSLH